MRLIIAGSRNLLVSDAEIDLGIQEGLKSGRFEMDATVIISGCANGVDTCAIEYAANKGLPCVEMPANWSRWGKSAGPRRNQDMALIADAALVFWDGVSRGSKNMIETMKRLGKPVHVVRRESL